MEALAPPTLGPHQPFTCFTSYTCPNTKKAYVRFELYRRVCLWVHMHAPTEAGRGREVSPLPLSIYSFEARSLHEPGGWHFLG